MLIRAAAHREVRFYRRAAGRAGDGGLVPWNRSSRRSRRTNKPEQLGSIRLPERRYDSAEAKTCCHFNLEMIASLPTLSAAVSRD